MSSRRQFLAKVTSLSALGVGSSLGLIGCHNDKPPSGKAQVADTTIHQQDVPSPYRDVRYDFYGEHQAGIITPAQRHVYFLVMDLQSRDVAAVAAMFERWTDDAAKLTQGENIKAYDKNPHLPPTDTGEADSLGAYGLTLTFGVSPSFFDKLGIQHKKPKLLTDLPKFPREQIRTELSGGDICIQACSEDPQVAFHAVRQLVRQARDKISLRWSQSGFNAFDGMADTPRNLFAFKDGTANTNTRQAMNEWLWADGDESWLQGGTYMVVRMIQMHLETWDRTSLKGQEDTFGRHRDTGAALGKRGEFDDFDLNATDDDGHLIIAEDTHVGLAKRTGQQLLRRSYSYASGVDARTGQFNAGLLFISFQKSPEQFSVIQNAFGNVDKMNEYTTHIGSGLFVCFGGVEKGEYLGQGLFEGEV